MLSISLLRHRSKGIATGRVIIARRVIITRRRRTTRRRSDFPVNLPLNSFDFGVITLIIG
jgi:hypothetical protein